MRTNSTRAATSLLACGQSADAPLDPQRNLDASVAIDAGLPLAPPRAALLCQSQEERFRYGCEPLPMLPREGWATCRTINFRVHHIGDPPCVRPVLIANTASAAAEIEPLRVDRIEFTVAEQDDTEVYHAEDVGFRVLDEAGEALDVDGFDPIMLASTATASGLLLFLEYRAVVSGYWGADPDHAGFTVETSDPMNPRLTIEIIASTYAPKISIAPAEVHFPAATLGATQTATVSISNEGILPLQLEAIRLEAADPNVTLQLGALGFEVEKFSTVPLFVRRVVADAAPTNAILLESNDPQRPLIRIPISFE